MNATPKQIAELAAYAMRVEQRKEETKAGNAYVNVPAAPSESTPVRQLGFTRIGEMTGIEATSWLIKPVPEANSLVEMFGDPEVGKSFMAIDMTCSVGTGTPWHGKRVKQGAVFYIAGEGMNNIRKRFHAWGVHHDVNLSDAPIFLSDRSAQLMSLDEADSVATTIGQMADAAGVMPALIVIDTLARNMGGDENSTADMSQFINAIDGALKHRFNACVLVIHHSGITDKNRGRGSTALKAGVDAEYQLTRGDDGVIRLTCLKMKDAAHPEPMAFTSRVIDLGVVDEDGDPVTSLALQSEEYEQREAPRYPRGDTQKLVYEAVKQRLIVSTDFGKGHSPGANVKSGVWAADSVRLQAASFC
ncbi:AAA family ATPase [Paraburkholderia sp. CI3]|uniref:AAA family ATPase n=1 Tax=Paraburkholderia sp. CI3 TaxID=2991060 RepID=UPI003D2568EB